MTNDVDLILSEDWADWYFHPMTRAFKKQLEGMVLDEKLERNFSDPNSLVKEYFVSEGRCLGLETAIYEMNQKEKEH
jgi:hypothetical protein